MTKALNTDTSVSTVYIGGLYEKTSTGTVTKYYSAAGARVMRSLTTAAGTPETGGDCTEATPDDDDGDTLIDDGCPMYLLADHLGGTTEALSSNGAVIADQKYWPYGERVPISHARRSMEPWWSWQPGPIAVGSRRAAGNPGNHHDT
jgi:hypothetical protein